MAWYNDTAVQATITEVSSDKRDLKAIITDYVLSWPPLSAKDIVRKVRALGLRPQPSTAEIYDMIDDIVDEQTPNFV